MQQTLRDVAWRLGRKMYCWARHDTANVPTNNGEYWLLQRVVQTAHQGGTFLDVGANVGDWTARAIEYAQAQSRPIRVIAFEPSAATRSILTQRFGTEANVEIRDAALAKSEGEADFFTKKAGGGTSSLHPATGGVPARVTLTTLDAFLEREDIEHVTILKIDTEGFDFSVLQGAEQALATGRIDAIQFEYNWRWLLNKASLLDVFDFIADKPYRFGKLTQGALVFFDKWHFELDRYFENNYVLIRKDTQLEALGGSWRFDARNVAAPTRP